MTNIYIEAQLAGHRVWEVSDSAVVVRYELSFSRGNILVCPDNEEIESRTFPLMKRQTVDGT